MWEVVELRRGRKWLCRCTCGALKLVDKHNLISGRSSQCAKCAAAARRERKLLEDADDAVHGTDAG